MIGIERETGIIEPFFQHGSGYQMFYPNRKLLNVYEVTGLELRHVG